MLVWNRPALLFISLRLAAGAMGHGPEMFQTFNQQHNPLQKIWKNCKNLWSAKTRSPMGPDGPRWALWASRLKRLLLLLLLSNEDVEEDVGDRRHYVLIRDLGALLCTSTNHKAKIFPCPFCLYRFTVEATLEKTYPRMWQARCAGGVLPLPRI